MLNQKSEGCIFLSQNAGLSVRHFITYHQILNCYTVCRNPHPLVCSLPETENFLLWGCGVFPPSQVLLKHVEYKQAEYVSCPGLFTLFVCLVLAAIGAIRLKAQAISNASIRLKLFHQCLHCNPESNLFSQCSLCNHGSNLLIQGSHCNQGQNGLGNAFFLTTGELTNS